MNKVCVPATLPFGSCFQGSAVKFPILLKKLLVKNRFNNGKINEKKESTIKKNPFKSSAQNPKVSSRWYTINTGHRKSKSIFPLQINLQAMPVIQEASINFMVTKSNDRGTRW
ncbi:MAG: hypothetical protein QGH65_12065 [SAR324 cluster bacterium]|nr:hypothetical protein [SAR324 cluster bacterium]